MGIPTPLKLASFAVVSVVVLILVLFTISKSRSFQFFGGLVNRVDTSVKAVSVTFDDAPTPQMDEVLSVLKEKGVPATFFVIGSELERDPVRGKAIVQAGHEIGNHSYSHERFLLKPMDFISHEVEDTNRLIRETGYTGLIHFRPPNGKKLFGLPYYLTKHGITTVMWDVEPDTYADTSADTDSKTDFLISYTLRHTTPGSIILLHPFCSECTADRNALPRIIDGLRARGYRFVTVSELLTYRGM